MRRLGEQIVVGGIYDLVWAADRLDRLPIVHFLVPGPGRSKYPSYFMNEGPADGPNIWPGFATRGSVKSNR